MNVRDALREVRENLASTTGGRVELAIATLSALVDQAGEPVGEPRIPVAVIGDDGKPELLYRINGKPLSPGDCLYTLPSAAPGASHE